MTNSSLLLPRISFSKLTSLRRINFPTCSHLPLGNWIVCTSNYPLWCTCVSESADGETLSHYRKTKICFVWQVDNCSFSLLRCDFTIPPSLPPMKSTFPIWLHSLGCEKLFSYEKLILPAKGTALEVNYLTS